MMLLGITPLVATSDVVTPAIVAILVAALTSGIGAYFARPKTKAEADQLNAAASVSMSAEAREWTRVFMARANQAEERANRAEEQAIQADERAGRAEERADEIEAALVESYNYVRSLRDEVARLGGRKIPAPLKLEALWRQSR